MISSGVCGCVDVQDPIRIRKLKEWAESDALFLRKLSMMTKQEDEEEDKRDKFSFSPSLGFAARSVSDPCRRSLDERFACRQRYLRSYTFSKDPDDKVTIIRKTKKQWLKLKKLNEKNKGQADCSYNSFFKGGLKLFFLNPVHCSGGFV